jgi:hypothetical protein
MHEAEVVREAGDLTYLTCDAQALRHPRRYVVTRREEIPPVPND